MYIILNTSIMHKHTHHFNCHFYS